jgi:hypothetical protein
MTGRISNFKNWVPTITKKQAETNVEVEVVLLTIQSK